MWMDDLCSEDGQRVYDKKDCCVVSRRQKHLYVMNFFCEQINHTRTAAHAHSQSSLKCRLPNGISFYVFGRCFCKAETRACETLRSCAKRLRGLAFISSDPVWCAWGWSCFNQKFVFGGLELLHAENSLKNDWSKFKLLCKKAESLRFIQTAPQVVLSKYTATSLIKLHALVAYFRI